MGKCLSAQSRIKTSCMAEGKQQLQSVGMNDGSLQTERFKWCELPIG